MITVPDNVARFLLPCLLCMVCACSDLSLRFPAVFRIDINQGNIVTQAMLDQLKPGMTQKQVTYVMGAPLIRDTLNRDRWDYYYSFSDSGEEPVSYHITLFFKNGRYTHHVGQLPDNPTPHL